MFRSRIIPCLLLSNDRLVKTIGFRRPKYVGDPINAVKLFNDLEVDELVVLDISATKRGSGPNFRLVSEIASECFMPVCYGGGVSTVDHAHQLFKLGIEKVALTTAAVEKPQIISQLAGEFGSQSIIVGIDVKHDWLRRSRVRIRCGMKKTGLTPLEHAREVERLGAGEILLNSIDRDGTQRGYDIELIREVGSQIRIPIIACGGAAAIDDFASAIQAGASAAAAGSLFVFSGPHRAVLINYPSQDELRDVFASQLCNAPQ